MSSIPIELAYGSFEQPRNILNGALYCTRGKYYVYVPKWYHVIFRFIWSQPSVSQYNIATIELKNHWVAHYGAFLIRQSCSITGIILEDRIARGKPLLVSEILRIQAMIDIQMRALKSYEITPPRRTVSPKFNQSTGNAILEIDMESCEITELNEEDDD